MGDRDIESWDKRLADQEQRGWENYLRRRINLDTARDLDLMAITGEFIYVEDVSSDSVTASIRLNRTSNDPIDLQLATQIKTIFTQVYITHVAQAGEWIDLVWGINFEYQKEHAIDIAQPVSVDDNGGSLTVDDGGVALTVDGAVSVDDGGGSLTIDGTVAISAVGGNVTVIDGGGSITVDDGGGVLTVDGTVAISGTVTTDDKEGSAQPCIIITNASADTNTPGAANACKVALVRAHTTNTGLVWVNTGAAAVEGSCYPLDAGDAVSFRTTNTNQINALFKVANEKVTVLYQN